MKILVVSNYYPPYYFGGYELSCFDTVEFLKKAGHEVTVLTGDYKKTSKNFEDVYRKLKYIDYEKPSVFNKAFVEKFNYEVTYETIEKVKPDLVYFWSLRLISLSPIWVVDKLQIKKVFEIGDFWMKGFLSGTFFSRLKRAVKNIFPFSISKDVTIDPVICVSKWMENPMKRLYGTKQSFVIPNGVKIQKPSIKSRDIMQFLFTGRIDYSKGLDLAIKALSTLKQHRLDVFEFHIYGDGDKEYLQKCKKLVQLLDLQKNVFFHGKCDNLEKAYEKSHVLLMPTRMQEAFGLVIIEAMTHKTLVIAPNAYGPREIIDDGKTGLLVKQNNLEELTNKLFQVYKNWQLIDEIGNSAYKKVKKDFDFEVVKAKVEKTLQLIVKDK